MTWDKDNCLVTSSASQTYVIKPPIVLRDKFIHFATFLQQLRYIYTGAAKQDTKYVSDKQGSGSPAFHIVHSD